jgi:hypothetical protein
MDATVKSFPKIEVNKPHIISWNNKRPHVEYRVTALPKLPDDWNSV